jgi:photosystem II stability/assembly factor-like uncharacterized protein
MNGEVSPRGRTPGCVLAFAIAVSLAGADASAQGSAGSVATPLEVRPARSVPHAPQSALLGAARAGSRIVLVGDHGVVLLSDDGGNQWRQAKSVPVRSLLNSVSFADDRHGWAVGHWGVVLATADGGETWVLQRSDTAEDRPLFAIHALDARHLVAVGLWSLILTSADGGQTWSPVKLAPPGSAGKRADLNLFHLFADSQGRLFAAGERGNLLRSDDRGETWTYLPTGYTGSFWTGVSPAPGVLVAAGLRGSIYRSVDDGKSWSRVDSGSKSSITAMLESDSRLIALGLDGLVLTSRDQGASFTGQARSDRIALTSGVVTPGGQVLMLSRQGVVK